MKGPEVIGKTWNFVQGETKGQITYTKSAVTAKFGGKTYKGKLRLKGDKICTAGTSQWQGDMLWSLKVRQWIQNHAWCYYYALIHEA